MGENFYNCEVAEKIVSVGVYTMRLLFPLLFLLYVRARVLIALVHGCGLCSRWERWTGHRNAVGAWVTWVV